MPKISDFRPQPVNHSHCGWALCVAFKEDMAITDHTILFAGALLVLSILASVASSRIGAPLLLVFLLLGMLFGEDGPGGIEFDDFGDAHLIATLGLAVILFDGGFRTSFDSVRAAWAPAAVLATVGVVITVAITGAAVILIFGADPLDAMLVGAVVASTDAAAVFLLLHQNGRELRRRVSATLEVESGANDPMAVFLTVALVEAITSGGGEISLLLAEKFAMQMGLGAIMGLVGGYALTWLVNRLDLAPGLYPVFVVAAALMMFGGTQTVGGSGFLAVYIAGIVCGNRRLRASQLVRRFHDGIAWVSQIVMFLMLGLLATPTRLVPNLVEAGAVAVVLMFLARPLAVLIALAPFRYSARERLFIAWVGLRGAVPLYLAIIPVLGGVPGGLRFFDIAFLVVLASLLLQGWTVPWLARRLGVEVPSRPEPAGKLDFATPSGLDRDVIGYRVTVDSVVAGRPLDQVALPQRARIIAVLRQNLVVPSTHLRELKPDDFVLMVAPPEQIFAVDRLFVARASASGRTVVALGDFTFAADVTVGAVADQYDLAIEPSERGQTLGELLEEKLRGRPAVGDSHRVGESELVVGGVESGRVASVILRLEAAGPLALPPDWRDRLRHAPANSLRRAVSVPGRVLARVKSWIEALRARSRR